VQGGWSSGEQFLEVIAALANPHRVRVVVALARGRSYVSELARTLGISRPLLQVHLRKLQAAGLVTSHLELSEEGRAMHYFELAEFHYELSPASVVAAASGLPLRAGHPSRRDPRKED
jgi:predicted transcriptional regulator